MIKILISFVLFVSCFVMAAGLALFTAINGAGFLLVTALPLAAFSYGAFEFYQIFSEA